jgi:hypothetical protein
MKNKIFLVAACFLIAAGAYAQKGIETGTPYGKGEDSINCVKNVSLFITYAKSNNYKDAFPFWKNVYDECPGSSIAVYQTGVNIIKWQISQESDAAKKDALIDELMKLYDNRVKYFGNDKRYGTDWIISRKAQDYNELKGDNTDYSVMYKWTGDIIDIYKEKTEPLAVSLFMFSSLKQMQSDASFKEKYIDDFLKVTALFDAGIVAAKAANNEKEIENLTARKAETESLFAVSGAADCETLQSIYSKKIEDNKTDLEFLKKTLTLFRRLGCAEIDAFFAASEYVHKIEPTAESAMGLGNKAFKSGDTKSAETYYIEAIGLTEDSDIKATLYLAMAAIANDQNQYSKAKQNALKCLAEKPDQGRAYIIIAQTYASTAKTIFPNDAVLTKCVYYAVVDKLERARQVDPSQAGEAARLINSYSKYFPTKEEIFMHPDLETGANFTIGGWIGETVKIR